MRSFFRVVENILWPRCFKCLCCDALSEGAFLCPSCRNGLMAMRLSEMEAAEGNIHSAYQYDGIAKQLVLLLKLECVADAAKMLSEEMAIQAGKMELPPETILTWVTMPERRRRDRGIDHGQLLCEAVADRIGLPMKQLLQRRGNIHTQRGLNYQERMNNLNDSLICDKEIHTPVLLIDDVMTTGATASACTQALMKAGAPCVYVLTATRVKRRIYQNTEM